MCVGGSYVQFDTIAYPCEAVASTVNTKTAIGVGTATSGRAWLQLPTAAAIKAIAGRVWSYAKGLSEGPQTHKDEHIYSLYTYLKPFEDALCGGIYTISLVDIAKEIQHLYTQMSHVHIINRKGNEIKILQISQVIVLCACISVINRHNTIVGNHTVF